MPRSRASELPQRQPQRAAPLHLKTNSEANSHQRSVDRRAKPEDRRSPRSPLHEKKRGTGVSDVETKLGEAQEELKMLRDRLALAEAAKLDAQRALEMAKKQIPSDIPVVKAEEEENLLLQHDSEGTSEVTQEAKIEEESVDSARTTDVFEVVAPTEPTNVENDDHSKPGEEATVTEKEEEEEAKTAVENEKYGKDQMVDKKEEQQRGGVELPNLLDLVELEDTTEVGIVLEENVFAKTTAESQTVRTADAARAKEEELAEKLRSTEEELKQSREKAELLTEQLQAAVGAKSMLEEEMKRLRVQTEQWRKAAETAAAALAAGDDVGHEEWGPALMDGDAMGRKGRGEAEGAGVRVFGDL
ncbi:unnamed protein product [Musa acuminata var. zebrina]